MLRLPSARFPVPGRQDLGSLGFVTAMLLEFALGLSVVLNASTLCSCGGSSGSFAHIGVNSLLNEVKTRGVRAILEREQDLSMTSILYRGCLCDQRRSLWPVPLSLSLFLADSPNRIFRVLAV